MFNKENEKEWKGCLRCDFERQDFTVYLFRRDTQNNKQTNARFLTGGGGGRKGMELGEVLVVNWQREPSELAIASQATSDGRRWQGLVDEIWTSCVPVRGSSSLVVPVTPEHGTGRAAGHRSVLSAPGWEQSRDEWRRQTESGCWWVRVLIAS